MRIVYNSYVNTADLLLQGYLGMEPFSNYIKKFFSENKRFGSTDRKEISSLCYYYFRLGSGAKPDLPVREKILLGKFICGYSAEGYFELIRRPDWETHIANSLPEKLYIIKDQFDAGKLFPFQKELSGFIDPGSYSLSYLEQPKLFLRVRPDKHSLVQQKLRTARIPYFLPSPDCIALNNAVKANDILRTDVEVVIQDLNSQLVFDYLKPGYTHIHAKSPLVKVWDCCAASGGKSLLLFDILKKRVDFTVSDIRFPILQNLHRRFRHAGIKQYGYFLADLAAKDFKMPDLLHIHNEQDRQPIKNGAKGSGDHAGVPVRKFDIIICDVPCTGSGTWSRTPEQLCFFSAGTIVEFAERQKRIVTNAAPYLAVGGYLIYITCSVFKKENEDVAEQIKDQLKLDLVYMEGLKGYDKKADTMFVAVFRK